MVGRSHRPDLLERLVRQQKDNTPRSVGGLARGATPGLVRDRVAARARPSGGAALVAAKSSKVDFFTVNDDSVDTFTLTYVPVPDSWNVFLNRGALHEDPADSPEFTIVGQTLTITDPADTFLAADTQSSPWKLRVQYDYLTSVPTTPSLLVPGSFVGSNANGSNGSTATILSPATAAGDLMLAFLTTNGPGMVTPPVGWTFVDDFARGDGRYFQVYSLVSPGTAVNDPYPATLTGANWWNWLVTAYAGFSTVAEINWLYANTGTSFASPTVADRGRVVQYVSAADSSMSWASPDVTVRGQANAGSGDTSAVGDRPLDGSSIAWNGTSMTAGADTLMAALGLS